MHDTAKKILDFNLDFNKFADVKEVSHDDDTLAVVLKPVSRHRLRHPQSILDGRLQKEMNQNELATFFSRALKCRIFSGDKKC